MTRLNILLLLAVIASALYLVQVSYETRRQFITLERERNQSQRLEQDAEKLRVLLRTQATHLRVEQMARERLQMTAASPAVTQYLTADGAVSAAAPSAAASKGRP
ncbi:cell division protein FtsL [Sphaerotilus montanus]|jgi:cell division protein FtsL|uniref:Cell division protein FtsL n=1 Tax=Sphaerotilus montanus TaxID=522889 RepID=A0A7Y9QXM7_9BURK|nr:cell division protein FtsL [Sphaerotilus montanus]MBP8270677.1 cell division protein FtsL [Sphaerotilus sp.]NYG33306.1 cell division protein FtsL [Sphaerotilus montanus]NZD57452.1 cell division protein FtsL [Sphaerotilus montanus]